MPATSNDYRSLWSVLQGLSSSLNTTLVSITSQPALYAALIQLDNASMGIPAPSQGATDEEKRKYNRKSGLQLLNELAQAASSFDDICDRCQDAAAAAAGLIPRWSAIPAQAIIPAGGSRDIDLAPYISSSLPVTLTAAAEWDDGHDTPVTVEVNGTVLTISTDDEQGADATLVVTVTATTSGGSAQAEFMAITADAPSISSLPAQVVRPGMHTTIDLAPYIENYLLPVTLSVTGLLAGDTASTNGTKLSLELQGEAVRTLTITASTDLGADTTTMSVTSATPPTILAIPDVEATTGTATTVNLAPYIRSILTPTITAYTFNPADTVTVSGTTVSVTPSADGVLFVNVFAHTDVGVVASDFKVTAAAAQS